MSGFWPDPDEPASVRGDIRIKVCGITREVDAAAAVASGVHAVGFVFVPGSPRAMSYESAGRIIGTLPRSVTAVGVFVRPMASDIAQAVRVAGISLAQVHDARDIERSSVPVPLLHAVRVGPGFDASSLREWGLHVYLLDTLVEGREGGTGRTFDWRVAAEARQYARVVLAGGLTPANVRTAIEMAGPYAVDVSSGVESAPGVKSAEKIEAFVKAVRGAAG